MFARRVVGHVADIDRAWRARIAQLGLRRSNPALRLLDVLPQNPVVNTQRVMDLLGVDKHAARRCLNTLEAAGVLVQRSAGKRNRVYEAEAVADAFSALADHRPGEPAPRPPTLQIPPPAVETRCGAETKRGGQCRHPIPRKGGQCQAGHRQDGSLDV